MERNRNKIDRIREHLVLLRSIKQECRERFESDRILLGALLHFLYLLTDGYIVFAELVITPKNLRLASPMRKLLSYWVRTGY